MITIIQTMQELILVLQNFHGCDNAANVSDNYLCVSTYDGDFSKGNNRRFQVLSNGVFGNKVSCEHFR